MKNTHWLVVLDDGETYGSVCGARLVEVTPEIMEEIENGTKIRDLEKEEIEKTIWLEEVDGVE
jgi:hypothetical protein